MASQAADPEAILRAIEGRTLEDQVALADRILQRARTLPPPPLPHLSWHQMIGIAATGKPAPSDEEVAQWLDDYRTQKYG